MLGMARAELLVYCEKWCPSWARSGQNFSQLAKISARIGPSQGRTFLCVVGKFCPSCAILGPYGQNFCPSLARPGPNFQYLGEKFCPSCARPGQNFWCSARRSANFGPGQGRTCRVLPKVLAILGPTRAELLIYGQKFCPSWAQQGQKLWRVA